MPCLRYHQDGIKLNVIGETVGSLDVAANHMILILVANVCRQNVINRKATVGPENGAGNLPDVLHARSTKPPHSAALQKYTGQHWLVAILQFMAGNSLIRASKLE